jgi:hypothetical protein
MRNQVTKIVLASAVFGLAGFVLPQAIADSFTFYNYYGSGARATSAGNARAVAAARPTGTKTVQRTVESPVIVERVVDKPVVVERVIERRVVVHKRHRGLIPKAYSMIFGG